MRMIDCPGCEDSYGAHKHCPLCDNYGLSQTHDNACPAMKGRSERSK